MTTFFPHLYEYARIVNLLKEANQNDSEKCEKKKCVKRCLAIEKNIETQILAKTSPNFDQYFQSKDLDFLLYLELKSQKLRESSYNPLKFYDSSLQIVLTEKTELSNSDKYQKPPEWPLDTQDFYHPTLNARFWPVVDAILCIEIAKILTFFKKLDIFDQQALLKSVTLSNIFLTSSYYSYAAFSDVIKMPDGRMPIKFRELHKHHKDLFQRIIEPIKRIEMSREEYVLLKTIIFCSSKSDSISIEGRKILEQEFQYYSRLLLKYEQAKHGDASGAVRYSQVISVIEAMTYFAQKAQEFFIYISMFESSPKSKLLEQLYC